MPFFKNIPHYKLRNYVIQTFNNLMQALDKGDNHTTEVGLSPENKKLNRFVDMTVCKLTCCRYDFHVGKAVSLRQNKLSLKLMIIFA